MDTQTHGRTAVDVGSSALLQKWAYIAVWYRVIVIYIDISIL